MNDRLTIADLEKRWKEVLSITRVAVERHPDAYRQLKSIAGDIIDRPVDIAEYMPTAEKIVGLLRILAPEGRGSIFDFFTDRITPHSIWQVPLLRVECKDLMAYLAGFDQWSKKNRFLRLVD